VLVDKEMLGFLMLKIHHQENARSYSSRNLQCSLKEPKSTMSMRWSNDCKTFSYSLVLIVFSFLFQFVLKLFFFSYNRGRSPPVPIKKKLLHVARSLKMLVRICTGANKRTQLFLPLIPVQLMPACLAASMI
jgi:hypothetical protein